MNLNAQRIAIRAGLAAAGGLAFVIPLVAFVVRGIDKPETWTVTAAALAVITSVVSAWSGRRSIELQEDAQRPKPYPFFDGSSRNQLALFRIKNAGGSSAHNIYLTWDTPLRNYKKEVIGFGKKDGEPAISVLLAGEGIAQIVAVHHEFISNHPPSDYRGFIHFEDVAGRQYKNAFRLDGRPFAGTPSQLDEWSITHSSLQKLPDAIESLRRTIERAAKERK